MENRYTIYEDIIKIHTKLVLGLLHVAFEGKPLGTPFGKFITRERTRPHLPMNFLYPGI